MSIKDLILHRIRMAILEAHLDGMMFITNKITEEEYERKENKLIQDLYDFISQAEPKKEGDII